MADKLWAQADNLGLPGEKQAKPATAAGRILRGRAQSFCLT
jgi:hypothetical protein